VWVGLPKDREEAPPDFHHHAADTLPEVEVDGVRVRVLAGRAFETTSPVRTLSPLFYVEAILPAGARLAVPRDHEARAIYVVEGGASCGSERAARGHMIVLDAGDHTLIAHEPSRVMLFGGEPLDGPRHIWWNFVSSSKERLEQAKIDWKEGRFAKIPGDETEFIPLPE
jgi:redox-sensitive bicupin YhaK (pirin superfamily)